MSEQSNNKSSPTESSNISMEIENKTPDVAPPENITIPFVLLTNLHNIMVAAGDRGAFKTAEMFDIGRVYKEVQEYLTQHLRNTQSTENTNTSDIVEASSLPEPEMATN